MSLRRARLMSSIASMSTISVLVATQVIALAAALATVVAVVVPSSAAYLVELDSRLSGMQRQRESHE